MAGLAYYILARVLVAHHDRDSRLTQALGSDLKGIISLVVYAIAVLISTYSPLSACALYVLVAIMWLVPDRRIEKALAK